MIEKTLLKITKILDNSKIPYMLIGGYAMVIHGFPPSDPGLGYFPWN